MSRNGAGILRWVAQQSWAVRAEYLEGMLDLLDFRAQGGRYTAEDLTERLARARAAEQRHAAERQATRQAARASVAPTASSVAVLPLYGVITPRADLMSEWSGGTSAEAFARDFDAAMADPAVTAIVLDVDSPGGNVAGVPELAERIYAARGQGKRIVAVANYQAASAAYWLASAADELAVSPSGEVGSIGVFCVHTDVSEADAKFGITRTIIKAGKYKAEGNPYEPLSDEARAAIQDSVDEAYGMFVKAVAKGRGVKAAAVRGGFGEGRMVSATQAVALGMADRVATLEQVLADLGVAKGARKQRMASAGAAPRQAEADERSAEMPDEMAPDGGTETETTTETRTCPECGADVPADATTCPDCGAPMDGADDDGETAAATTRTVLVTAPTFPPGEEARAREWLASALRQLNDTRDVRIDFAATTGPNTTRTAGGAAAQPYLFPATTTPRKGKESPVPHDETTAPQTGANGAAAAVLAERKRASEIRALCKAHDIDAAKADEYVDAGLTVEQASRQILDQKAAALAAAPQVRMGADREAERPFKTLGEQLVAIVQAGRPGGRVDRRLLHVNQQALKQAAASGMNESVGSEGGFFIATEVLPGITDPAYAEDPILSRVFRVPSSNPSVKYNVVDETSRATGSRWGGIQMYWAAEADTATAKKPKLRQMELALKKLLGFAYLTDELQQDAPAAEALLTRAFQAERAFMLADGIFRGTGAGQMLGFLNSGAMVSQAIEGGQTIANTPQSIALNVSKMLSHVPASLWGQVIWLYNQELLPYLITATVGAGGSTVPVFLGAQGISGRPYDTILGRPAFASELCEAVGTPGDLVLIAPSEYHMLQPGGPQLSTSVHVRFLYDENTLKIVDRVDGAPVWRQTVTPYKGAAARSPFVTLAARA